jgi:hypothetical protein
MATAFIALMKRERSASARNREILGYQQPKIDFRRSDMMFKLKQVLQGRILLLLLGEIVLGSILFSMTACEEVNLTNQGINPLQQEQEFRKNLGTITNAQVAYRLEHNKFSNSFKELEITTVTDSKNYKYRIYRGIQRTLNNYLFLDAEQMKTKSLKLPEEEAFTPPQNSPAYPRIY